MNERIQELMDQAAEYAIELTVKYPELYIPTFTEKFAELIVRECTNMLPPDSIRDENGVHMFYVIRKHFGVSEIGR